MTRKLTHAEKFARRDRRRWNRKARIEAAREILQQVSADHNIDVRSLMMDARFGHMVDARRDYARRCVAYGISSIIAGEVIGRDHTSILNAAGLLPNKRRPECLAS